MDEKVRKTFWGSESDNTCAFCYKHHLSLTPAQLRRRGCLQKQCNAFKKCDHPIWEDRERRKELRKARKIRLEETYRLSVRIQIE